jgi:hypothetical protein
MVCHARLQVHAVGPHVDVAPGRQVARLPALVLVLPRGREPADDGGGEVRGILAEQGRQRVLEVAGRDPAQVQDRQKCIEAAGAP